MDLIPPYLLSTAFGEQYLLLLAQHERLAAGPAPASFSTTAVTPETANGAGNATSAASGSSANVGATGIEVPESLISVSSEITGDSSQNSSLSHQVPNFSFSSDTGVPSTTSTSQSSALHDIASSLWAPPMAPLRAAGAPGGGPRVVSTLAGFRDDEIDDGATDIVGDGLDRRAPAQDLDGDFQVNDEPSNNDETTDMITTSSSSSANSPQHPPLPPRLQTRVTATTQTGGSPAVIISVIRHPSGATTTTSSNASGEGSTTNSNTNSSDNDNTTRRVPISQLQRSTQLPYPAAVAATNPILTTGQVNTSDARTSLLTQIHNIHRARLAYGARSNSGRQATDDEIYDGNDNDDDEDDDDDDEIDVDDEDEARESILRPYDSTLSRNSNPGGNSTSNQKPGDSGLENNSIPPGLLFLGLSPLPSSWVYHEVASQPGNDDLAPVISQNGLLVSYESKSKPSIQETRTLKTDYPIPPLCGVFYYEVEILSASRDTTVSVGLCTDRARLTKVPGHAEHTWGFHSDDGCFISPQDRGSSQTHKFGTHDVVGCGVNFARGSIFFTKNGIHLGEAYTGLEFAAPATFPHGASAVEASTSGKAPVPPLRFTRDIFREMNLDSARSGINFGDLSRDREYSPPYNSNTRRSNRNGTGRNANDGKILEVYPCIGFQPSVKLQTNFGSEEFRFNIERYVKETKDTVMDEILVANTLPLGEYKEEQHEDNQEEQEEKEEGNGASLTHADMPEFVQNLVASYFTYMGYVDTAREFRKELEQEQRLNQVDATGGGEAEDVEMEDATKDEAMELEDANILNRQKIGQLIVEGHIDAALSLLQKEYPKIVEDDESLVVLKLRCLKFVELVKEGPTGLARAIAYGQELREVYKHDRRVYVQDRLSRTFALLAYESLPNTEDDKTKKSGASAEDEVDPALAALLGPSERFQLADEINSLILVSLGQPPVAGIKKMVQHTMAMMWDLQNFRDRLDTSVLNVHQDYLY